MSLPFAAGYNPTGALTAWPDFAVSPFEKFVALTGDDDNDGRSWAHAFATVAAAIASLPRGVSGQPIGIIRIGPGLFNLGATTLEIGYGRATGEGFAMYGFGEGITTLFSTSVGTAVRLAHPELAEQKLRPRLAGFTLSAPNALIGFDLKGSSKGRWRELEVLGASVAGNVRPGGVAFSVDASYGAAIGAWWNKLWDSTINGFATGVLFTGVPGNGQANENDVLRCRIGLYTEYGVNDDVGDHVTVEKSDLTSSANPIAGIRLNGLASQAISDRFESIQRDCVLVDADADLCVVERHLYASANGSVGTHLAAGSARTAINGNRPSVGVIPVLDESTGLSRSTISVIGADATNPNFPSVRFAITALPANGTVVLDPVGAPAGFGKEYIARPFQIRGIEARLSNAITAGTATFTATINGVPVTFSLVLAAGNAGDKWQNMNIDTGSAIGLGAQVVCAGLAPAASLLGIVTVLFEYTG